MKRLTYEFVKESFEKEGYELLNEEYTGDHSKLKYRCSNGHTHNISWSNWKSGKKCPYCAGKAKLTIEFIRSEFAKEDYKLLTKEYKNNKQKLDYICPKGHRHSIVWHDWQRKRRCFFCAKDVSSMKRKLNFNTIKDSFEKENYILLTRRHRNNKQKLDYICPRGHRYSIRWNDWQQGHRCPECVGKISKGETEVRNFVKFLGIEVSSNDRNQIFNPETGNGLELDIFMPTLNKAIEYNGEYWHQDKSRGLLKQELCKLKGINLLTIWDKGWLNESEKCKNKIKKFIFNEGAI